jgi:hypothetical protein
MPSVIQIAGSNALSLWQTHRRSQQRRPFDANADGSKSHTLACRNSKFLGSKREMAARYERSNRSSGASLKKIPAGNPCHLLSSYISETRQRSHARKSCHDG